MITDYIKGFKERLDAWIWKRERLGIYLDGPSTRVVRLRKSASGRLRLGAFAELDVGLLGTADVARQKLRIAVKQLSDGIQRAAVNMEHPSLRVRKMNFPKMPEGDLEEAIRWNFREHIEGPIERYVVGHTPIDETADEGRMSIMAYGVSSEAIDEYVKAVKSLGLSPISLEPASTALLAAMKANNLLEDQSLRVCVLLGDGSSIFSVMRARSMLFCRPLPGVSNTALARLVMRNLNMDEEPARALIKEWMSGERGDDAEGEALMKRLDTTIGHFYSQTVIEIQRSIDAFCIMYSVEHVDSIHLCGMGVLYPGAVEHIGKTLGLPCEVFNPFERIADDLMLTEAVVRQAPLYAVAVGLAIP